MDGFAYAGEALTGKCIGERNHTHLRSTVLLLFKWGIGLSAVFTLLYGIGGQGFLGLLTDDSTVISASSEYFYWVLAIPIAGFSAFLLDGICIGATATRIMLKAMIVASVSFFLVYFGTRSMLYNHAIWMGFIVYLSLRGIMQAYWLRRLRIFERSWQHMYVYHSFTWANRANFSCQQASSKNRMSLPHSEAFWGRFSLITRGRKNRMRIAGKRIQWNNLQYANGKVKEYDDTIEWSQCFSGLFRVYHFYRLCYLQSNAYKKVRVGPKHITYNQGVS